MFFANGVLNTECQARKAWLTLKDKVKAHLRKDFVGYLQLDKKPDLAYNTSEPLLVSLLEAYIQKADVRNNELYFFYWLRNRGLPKNKKAAAQLLEDMNALLERYYVKLNQKYPDLSRQTENYRSVLENGEHVLTVAHSQGNLFTNAAYNSLMEPYINPNFRGVMRIVAVATPASYVAGTPPNAEPLYTTLKADTFMRILFNALPANQSCYEREYFKHLFVDDYLANDCAAQYIIGDIGTALSDLIFSSKNRPFGAYGYELGYVDPSLIAFMRFVHRIQDYDVPLLTAEQCFGFRFGLKVFDWFGEKCTDRSFEQLRETMQNCLDSYWQPNDPEYSPDSDSKCPVFDLTTYMDRLFPSTNLSRKWLKTHPECRISKDQLKNGYVDADLVSKALEFLINPDSR